MMPTRATSTPSRNTCSRAMILAAGDVYAQIPRLMEVRELMRATEARIREQPGCVSYVFAETLDDPGHFVVLQRWRDRAALEDHYLSEAFAYYQEQIRELVVRTSVLREYLVQETFRPLDSQIIDTSDDD
jgi:quinol monooxygenase YgiN